jgi:hypothetical protein
MDIALSLVQAQAFFGQLPTLITGLKTVGKSCNTLRLLQATEAS